MKQVASKDRWREALDAYRYPVSLPAYKFRHHHEGWFKQEFNAGDRDETVGFEYQFRRQASKALEPWFEVVFWKLGSQFQIRNGTTQRIAKNLAEHTTAEELWRRCVPVTLTVMHRRPGHGSESFTTCLTCERIQLPQ
jgi:hypothetical protein